ncbi:FG-GAP-like repeat-containing protein [bacterium]|nr:FG-GAP-like repeat-containing protein [bacterium]
MKSTKYGLHIILFSFLLISFSHAGILRVQDDYETIQGAIDASEDGDTVLVEPGTYLENLDIPDHSIVLASQFLFSGDEQHITNTIIDGDSDGRVILVHRYDDGFVAIIGFTVQNGYDTNGGGIYTSRKQTQIRNCIISNNESRRDGAGICGNYTSDFTISDCIITNNTAGAWGGGLECNGRFSITNCIIQNNQAELGGCVFANGNNSPWIIGSLITGNSAERGGGIYCNGWATVHMDHCTTTNNSASDAGGAVYCAAAGEIIAENSIFYSNEPDAVSFNAESYENLAVFSYCDVEGGTVRMYNNDNGEIRWDDSNIEEDPLFTDPDNADYHLTEDSPCIDAGDPDADADPDETRADMGAYYHPRRDEVLNVPDDYETIQAAIDAAEDGDIVLVEPGTYTENIDFNGKNITVASLYLNDPDEDIIDETIIDGDGDGNVVRFMSEETERAVLIGFTIQNGHHQTGGGINGEGSSPTIARCKIIQNDANYGGGIFFSEESAPVISYCEILGNTAIEGGGIMLNNCQEAQIDHSVIALNSEVNDGGGLALYRCESMDIDHCLITYNFARNGGGVFASESQIRFSNCTIVNNRALTGRGGGIHSDGDAQVDFSNTIIWDNAPAQVYAEGDDFINRFSYNDVEGGEDDIETNGDGTFAWGGGNINDDPEFVDAGHGDYHLTEDSPCIDTGDPDSPEDPDETRADMGAYYFHQQYEGNEFTEHNIDDDFGRAESVYAIDIDSDGDIDVLGAAADASEIAWWENDGDEGFEKHTIKDEFGYAYCVYASDVDDDGDIDVLGTALTGSTVSWWENDGEQDFTEHVIDNEISYPSSVLTADIDEDGDVDVIGTASRSDEIIWWENDGDQNFEKHIITDNYDGAHDVRPIDLDNDGDWDLVSIGYEGDCLTWWENDGDQEFTRRDIADDFDGAIDLDIVDLDADGDIDIIGTAYDGAEITWWENDGDQNFSAHNIIDDFSGAVAVHCADLNGDGDIDVVGAAEGADEIIWWENDGDENFSDRLISDSFDGVRSIYVSDIDSDGDFDIIGACRGANAITWWENDLDPPQPEIEVNPMSLEFGEVSVNESEDLTFTVINNGDENLTVEGFAVEGEYFEISNEDGFMLRPNQRTTRTVTFAPRQAGEFEGIVIIISNDPNNAEFEVELSGIALPNIEFTQHNLDTGFNGAYSVFSFDLDNDGDIDVLGAAYSDDEISWWENDGNRNFSHHYITEACDGAQSAHAADIDGDGDIDVIGASNRDNYISWWENNGNQNFSEHTIINNIDGPTCVLAVDIDSDGDTDVLGLSEDDGEVLWWENDGDQEFERHLIANNYPQASAVCAIDIDEDDDMDILGTSPGSNCITLWENDGDQDFSRHDIANNFAYAIDVCVEDIDSDGDIDVIGASYTNSTITWWENDGDLNFDSHLITDDFSGVRSVVCADVNNDGNIDVLGAAYAGDEVTWWENDGDEQFETHNIAANFGRAIDVYASDLDSDGDIDVVGAANSSDYVTWWESNLDPPLPSIAVQPQELNFEEVDVDNHSEQVFTIANDGEDDLIIRDISIEGLYFDVEFEEEFNLEVEDEVEITVSFSPRMGGEFTGTVTITSNDPRNREVEVALTGVGVRDDEIEFTEHVINNSFRRAYSVFSIDVDGDGDIDVLGAANRDDEIAWWENDGNENFAKHSISENCNGVMSVYAADVDGDGDIDVLGAEYTDDEVIWWENDGDQNFTERILSNEKNGPTCVLAKDIDRDGDLDILGTAYNDDEIIWWENDGEQDFTEHIITNNYDQTFTVDAADLDEDGDTDILSTSYGSDCVTWWENDGDQNFSRHDVSSDFDGAWSTFATDLDSDGDLDIVASAYTGNLVTWWENDGNENFNAHSIANNVQARSITYGDIDVDGDIDIIGAVYGSDEVVWWENDGDENFSMHSITDSFDNAIDVYVSDIDLDGDLDILGAAYGDGEVTWWENGLNPETPDIVVDPMELDFGAVDPEDDGSVMSFTIGNNGAGDLIISNILVDGDYFSVDFEDQFVIEADEEVEITVIFTPEEEGEFTGVVTIFSNDPDEREMEVELTGTGVVHVEIGFTEHVIDNDFDSAFSVFIIDVDSDGDMDVLCAAISNDLIAWWENDGDEDFTRHLITENFSSDYCIYAADMDNDDDIDVLASDYRGDAIIWLENDGEQNFEDHIITDNFDAPWTVIATDLDDDGDIDVLGTASRDDEITWWENDGDQNFDEHIISENYNTAYGVYAVDIDDDGDTDILSTANEDHLITLWENDGDENFDTHNIQNDYNGINEVIASDIDSDGDIDILGAAFNDDKVVWFENDGEENFSAHDIAENFDFVRAVFCADLDNDGDIDVIGAADSGYEVTWWENDGDENFTTHNLIDNFDGAADVFAGDIDSDGDIDIVGTAFRDNTITWWENDLDPDIPGIAIDPLSLDFGSVNINQSEAQYFNILNEGDNDLTITDISVEGDYFYVNFPNEFSLESQEDVNVRITFTPEAAGEFEGVVTVSSDDPHNREIEIELSGAGTTAIEFTYHLVDGDFSGVYDAVSCDLDSDGDIDIIGVANQTSEVAWWENDGAQNFNQRDLQGETDRPTSLFVEDIDGDEDIDVFVSHRGGIAWWENDDNQRFEEHVLDNEFLTAGSVYVFDIDSDGDMDVIGGSSLSDGGIAWWENDGDEDMQKHIVYTGVGGITCVYPVDIDNDGDIDILAGSTRTEDAITIWENDGEENFEKRVVADDDFRRTRSVRAIDLDVDGDLDIVAAADINDRIAWWENDGELNFERHIVTDDFEYANDVFPADFNFDGNIDLVGVARNDDKVSWWENDGDMNFTETVIANDFEDARAVYVDDIDLDGDYDFVAVANDLDDIAWWENSLDPPAPRITVDENQLDFGEIDEGDSGELSLTVTNIGNVTLTVNELIIDGIYFDVNFGGEFDLETDESREFTVTFSPDASGMFNGTLTIQSNDPHHRFVTVTLVGLGTGGVSFEEHLIDGGFSGAYSINVGDLDDDGDLDLAGVSRANNLIAYWINDGEEDFERTLLSNELQGPSDVSIEDFNSNRERKDIFVTLETEDRIIRYENRGDSFRDRVVEGDFDSPRCIKAGDLDKDGDIDILGASYRADGIVWWENDGDENLTKHTVYSGRAGTSSVMYIDLDNDGDFDILAGSTSGNDAITWWENDGSQEFDRHTIDDEFGDTQAVNAADLDGDGDIDVLGASSLDSEIAWWENDGDQGFEKHTIQDNYSFAIDIATADFDCDGDIDLLSAAKNGNEITWWENDGDASFARRTLSNDFDGANRVRAVDLDQDGDIDIVAVAEDDNDVTWWENGFNPAVPDITVQSNSIDFGEVDEGDSETMFLGISNEGENDLIISDIIMTNDDFSVDMEDEIVVQPDQFYMLSVTFAPEMEAVIDGEMIIFCNDPDEPELYIQVIGEGTGWLIFVEHLIDDDFNAARAIEVIDMDGDGDIDVVGAASAADEVAWWENDGEQNFRRHAIDDNYVGALTIFPIDVDGDGDIDVVGGSTQIDDVSWWENDGNEDFRHHNIANNFDGTSWVSADDVDSDGDIDVLACAQNSDQIAWWENDGAENFSRHIVNRGFNYPRFIGTSDLDSDGDVDIIACARSGDDLAWWRNQGQENFSMHYIDENEIDGACNAFCIDMDEDGDIDVLAAANIGNQVLLYLNDGDQNFDKRIIDNNFIYARRVSAIDVDYDGDLDIVGAAQSNDVTWWENKDFEFVKHHISRDYDGSITAVAIDMDGDMDVDVVGAAHHVDAVTWWESTLNPMDNIIETDRDTLDFENVGVFRSKNDTLIIRNTSDWELIINDITTSNDYFMIEFDQAIHIPGHDSVQVPVTFAPWEVGQATGIMTIFTNDRINREKTVVMIGEGVIEMEFTEHTIDDAFEEPNNVISSDVDGDGDMDVIGIADTDDELVWWENNGEQEFSRHLIADDLNIARALFSTDLDNDGDVDILTGDHNNLYFWENDGDEEFTRQRIWRYYVSCIYAVDLDEDGDMDIICIQAGDDIYWLENNGEQDFSEHLLYSEFPNTESFTVDDLDADGDFDVIVISDDRDNKVAWFENDGDETFTLHAINEDMSEPQGAHTIDLDSDGDIDVLVTDTREGDVIWFENDGNENFEKITIDDDLEGAHSINAGDFDCDGDIDVVCSSRTIDDIVWYENNGWQNFNKHVIRDDYIGSKCVIPVDIDGDYDLDILGSAHGINEVTWWENPTDPPPPHLTVEPESFDFGETSLFDPVERFITISNDGDHSVRMINVSNTDDRFIIDFDGLFSLPPHESAEINITFLPDTAIAYSDVITVTSNDPSVRRTTIPMTGTGILPDTDVDWTRHDIIEDYRDPRSIHYSDIDGDGDIDFMVASYAGADISWFKNDGEMNFERHSISDNFRGANSVYSIDIDLDEDMDILGAAQSDDEIAWWDNDGEGNFEKRVITDQYSSVSFVMGIDLDMDDDIDLISGSSPNNVLTWWENDGDLNFEQHDVDDEYTGCMDLMPVDIDSDGDYDLLAASPNISIAWWENDGNMNYGERQIIDEDFTDARRVFAADLDNDGDMDIMGSSVNRHEVAWWENDGEQHWTKHLLRDNLDFAYGLLAVNLDLDEDIDIIISAEGNDLIHWWESLDGEYFMDRIVDSDYQGAYKFVCPDLDLDGDYDIICLGDGTISWWENGFDPGIPDIDVDPRELDFGNVWIDESADLTLTISNEGREDLIVSEITVGNEVFTTDFGDEVTLRTDENIEVTVTFTPGANAEFSSELVIFSNDPNETEIHVSLEGTGFSNNPPEVIREIGLQVKNEDFARYTVADLDTVFFDPDEDELEYSAESANENLIVEIDDANRLWLSVVHDWNGRATITLLADDGHEIERDRGPVRVLRGFSSTSIPACQGDVSVLTNKNPLVSGQVVCPTDIVGESNTYDRQLRGLGRVSIGGVSNPSRTSIPACQEEASVLTNKNPLVSGQVVCPTDIERESNTHIRQLRGSGSAGVSAEDVSIDVNFGEIDFSSGDLRPRRDADVGWEFDILVRPVPDTPVWEEVPDEVEVDEGEAIEFTVHASDADGDDLNIDASSEGLPDGWQCEDIGGGTGIFTWEPTFDDAGSYTVEFTASDGMREATAETRIIVHEVAPPEWVTVPDPITVSEGALIEFTLEGTGLEPEILTITYSSDDLPEEVEFTDNGEGNASFTWQTNHTNAGEYTANFILSDGEYNIEAEVSITVEQDNVLNVPDEYATIQGAIDMAADGDTVLVDPGEYVENINFLGKDIAVIGNPDDPSEVIIDGNENGTVVTFNNEETEDALLTGFTINNGSGTEVENYIGGGVYCSDGSMGSIFNCRIIGNNSDRGGGVAILSGSSLLINNCVIMGNSADLSDGGIRIYANSSAIITNSVICRNNADNSNSGIGVYDDCSLYMDKVTISDNQTNGQIGGIGSRNADEINITNSIIFGNSGNNQISNGMSVTYSDVQGGYNGRGNIDADPLFADAENGDYRLSWENYPEYDETCSPCIDAGDPDSEDDPDDTRADMGAYYFHYAPVQDISVSPEAIDFGEISYTSLAQETLTISNLGSDVLTVTNITVGNDVFAVDFDNEFTLQPRASREFTVVFESGEPGEFETDLIVYSNDEDEDEVTVHLSGVAVNYPPDWTDTPENEYTITEGDFIEFDLSGSDPDGDDVNITAELPDNAELNDNGEGSAHFSWQTYHDDGGENSITFTLSDGNGSVDFEVVITVIEDHVLNVPEEYETIQGAIDRSADGDTVLVADGTYRGAGNRNITFDGKDIIIRSENGAENCIIDCEEEGRGFSFTNGETDHAQLIGITISNSDVSQNGADNEGGGVLCDGSSPKISNCIFTGNIAAEGAAIQLMSGSNAIISNCQITENYSTARAGVVSIKESEATIFECLIARNRVSGNEGGGSISAILCNPMIIYCTIVDNILADDNEASTGGFLITRGSHPIILGCIIRNNSNDQILMRSNFEFNYVTISYTNIEGNEDGINTNDNGEVTWGEGNIDADPLFADAENGDYHLSWANYPTYDDTRSPCIDAGDPESDNDPDDTRADMGAYYFHYQPVPDITVEPEAIEFGEISYNAVAEEMLTITNIGSEDLRVTNISINGDGFVVNFANAFVLGPTQTRQFRITFDTNDEAGEYEGELIIASDDPDEGELTVSLTGIAVNHAPVWDEFPDNIEVYEGDEIYFVVSGNDADEDILDVSMELDGLPEAAEFNPVHDGRSGEFTWQTTFDDAGEYTPTFSISDGVTTLDSSLTITVINVNQPPEVRNPIEDFAVNEDIDVYRVADLNEVFFDPDGDEMSFNVDGIGELNLSLDGDGILTLEPDVNYYGESEVTAMADDGQEDRDQVGPVRDLRSSGRTSILACQNNYAVATNKNVCPTSRQLRSSMLERSDHNPRRDAQAECTFTVTVINVNDPPAWVDYPTETIEIDALELIQFTLIAEDIDNEELNVAWDSGDLPGEATLGIAENGKSADFEWQTTRVDVGEYLPIFIVSDGEDDHEIEVSIIVNPSRVPQHFTEFTSTDASHHLRVTTLGLYERDAQTGWEVGIFTPDGLLAGAGVWIEGEVMTMEAWADDPETGDRDGFTNNELFDFMIWEPDEDQEYDGVAWFVDGPEVWQEDATSTLSLDAFVPGETVVSLREGWNYISLNVYPGPEMYSDDNDDGPDVRLMMEQLMIPDDHHRIITMKDDNGNVYSPAYDFNDIPYWSPIDAYQVQIDETIETTWYGAKIPYNTNIPLNDEWNLVPYYPDYELSAYAPDFYVLSDIIESVVFAKDEDGNFLAPRYGYSEMPPWQPGKGYYINISEDVVLNYPEEQEQQAMVHRPRWNDNADRHWNFTPQSGRNMSLLLTSIDDDIASGGDEIAVFGSSGSLAGVGIVSDGKCGISVWGDDKDTEIREGLINGEAFELKVRNAQSGIERSLITQAILHGDQLTYSDDELLVIEVTLTPELPQTVSLSEAYPNPFNAVIRLSYTIPEESFVKLAVYDLRGNEVEVLASGQQTAGYYSTNWNGIHVPSGVYMVRLEAGGKVDVRKVVLMR